MKQALHKFTELNSFIIHPLYLYYSLIVLFYCCNISSISAEGTKELAPNPTDRLYLLTNASGYYDFATYNSTDEQRIYFNIDNPLTEQVFLGFSQPVSSGHFPCSGNSIDAYFRIIAPNGRVVYPEIDNPRGQLLTDSTINILAKSQAMNGPNQIVNIGGYNAFLFNPSNLESGDYYIEFSQNEISPSAEILAFEWWDITVSTKGVNPTAIIGRVFSKNWTFMSPSISCGIDANYGWFDRPFNGNLYIYTNERVVSVVDFNGSGFQGAAFNIFFNASGAQTTGNVIEDRKSIEGRGEDIATYQIFLNDPDINVYPTGVFPDLETTATFYSCPPDTGCIASTITEAGLLEAILDFDKQSGDYKFDPGTADVYLFYVLAPIGNEQPPFSRCIPWSGNDGLGERVQPGELVDVLVRYTEGTYNFPIFDVEYLLNGISPQIIRPVLGNSSGLANILYYDDSNISVSAGTGTPINNSINGCEAPCHSWSNQTFGDNNTINTWFSARTDHVFQMGIKGCPIDLMNDTSSTPINIPADLFVLENDGGDSVIATNSIKIGNITPKNGMIEFDPTNGIGLYTPNNAFIGQDSFEYVACFNTIPPDLVCDTAMVYIDVTPVPEKCENNIDDDGDGFIDCDDPDCQHNPSAIIIHRKKSKQ